MTETEHNPHDEKEHNPHDESEHNPHDEHIITVFEKKPRSVQILALLYKGYNQSQICQILKMKRGNVSVIVSKLVSDGQILHIRSPQKADKYILTDKAQTSQEVLNEIKNITPMTGDDTPKSLELCKIPFVRCHRKPHKCKAKILKAPVWTREWTARKTKFRAWESYIHEAKAYGKIVLSGNDEQNLSAVVYLPDIYTDSLEILDNEDGIWKERSKRLMQELSKQGVAFQDTLTPLSSGEYGIVDHPAAVILESAGIKGKVRLTTKERDGFDNWADCSGRDQNGQSRIEDEYNAKERARNAVIALDRMPSLMRDIAEMQDRGAGMVEAIAGIVATLKQHTAILEGMNQKHTPFAGAPEPAQEQDTRPAMYG